MHPSLDLAVIRVALASWIMSSRMPVPAYSIVVSMLSARLVALLPITLGESTLEVALYAACICALVALLMKWRPYLLPLRKLSQPLRTQLSGGGSNTRMLNS